jgi:hypothetical protein
VSSITAGSIRESTGSGCVVLRVRREKHASAVSAALKRFSRRSCGRERTVHGLQAAHRRQGLARGEHCKE